MPSICPSPSFTLRRAQLTYMDLFFPWCPCHLVSIWVHPMGSQQDIRGRKEHTVLMFILFHWLLPWGVASGLVVTHDRSSWFLSGGPFYIRLCPLTNIFNCRAGNRGKPTQNMGTDSLIFLSSGGGRFMSSPLENGWALWLRWMIKYDRSNTVLVSRLAACISCLLEPSSHI